MNAANQQELKDRILREAVDLKLPCSQAFKIAKDTGSTTAEVGKTCNELEVKIISCQLGCF